MKSFLVIISFYFLSLAVLPCHCAFYADDLTSELAFTDHHDDDIDFEKCTSFCACASFHNPIIAEKKCNIEIKRVIVQKTEYLSLYTENKTKSHIEPPLRPPQA